MIRHCGYCNDLFVLRSHNHKFCCYGCRSNERIERQQRARDRAREKHVQLNVADYNKKV